MGAATTVTDDAIIGPHGAVPVRRYDPGNAASLRLVRVHGGAFVSGRLDRSESHGVGLALAALGIPVTTVGYRPASTRLCRLLRAERGADGRCPVPAVAR